ncbi:hypothetical protein ACFQ0M_45850 [Kitasatospora aburaviensis]
MDVPRAQGEDLDSSEHALGGATASVEGHDVRPPGTGPIGRSTDWKPQPQAPVVTGTETVTVGPDSAEAKAARAATGGASPASGGLSGSKAGNLAVQIAPGSGNGESAHTVTVQVVGEDKGKAAGVTTPLVTLTDAGTAPVADGRTASVTLDLKALRASGWSDRAAIVSLPACALSTPERPECRTRTPLPSRLGSDGKTTVDVTLPPATASPTPARARAAAR